MTNGGGSGSASEGGDDHELTMGTDPDGRNRDHQLRSLIDAVEEYAIFRLDTDGTVASWNPGAKQIKGYEADEILGKHFSAFYTTEDREVGVPEANLRAAAARDSVEDEGWRVRADGSTFWANVTITAIRDDDGDLEGFAKVTRDMTERREHEQLLREERDFTEQILDTAPAGIFVIDADGEVVLANDRLERMFGLSDATTELSIADLDVYDEDGDPIPPTERPYNVALETGEEVSESHCQVALSSGERLWLSLNVSSITAGDGEVERVVVAAQDVTRLRAQAERIERQRDELDHELKEVFERVDDAFFTVDDDWRITYVNEHAAELVEASPEQLVGEIVWEALPEVADGRPREMAERAMETQETVEFEFHSELLDIWTEVRLYPSETGVSVYFRDVTDRKRRERKLEASERRYRTLVENFPDGVVALFDEDLRYTAAGGQLMDDGDVVPAVRAGERVVDLFPEDLFEEIAPHFDAALAGEATSFDVEYEGRHLFNRTMPVRDVDEEVHAGMIMVQDVTERREYERELESRARQQRAVAELGQLAHEVDDLDELFREAASQVAEVLDNEYCKVLDLDRDAGELLLRQGVGWDEGIAGQATVDANENSQAGYTLLSEEPVVVEDLETETRFQGPALLTDHDVTSGISTIIGSIEEPWGILGTHDTASRTFNREDVNFVQSVANILAETIERHRYEAELELLVERLEESNERLEQFAYAASHDLQEPLRMVSSYLQLIEGRYGDELDDDAEEFLAFAVDGADRMRNMIDGLLKYSRVETEGEAFEPVDLEAVLADVRNDLSVRVEETDAEITAGSLPTVEGDPRQLRQVFQNLLDNAMEYSGDDPPRVHVSAERDGDVQVISVRDEGIGIDPEHADRIFEVFQSLHAPDEHEGTGIGLALSERIVERHGGEIWVDSEPGEGATFSFTLPAATGVAD